MIFGIRAPLAGGGIESSDNERLVPVLQLIDLAKEKAVSDGSRDRALSRTVDIELAGDEDQVLQRLETDGGGADSRGDQRAGRNGNVAVGWLADTEDQGGESLGGRQSFAHVGPKTSQ